MNNIRYFPCCLHAWDTFLYSGNLTRIWCDIIEISDTWNMWLLIISYLVLGAVLLYHYDCFDWAYGCLLWLVAAFTYLYPIEVASLLPYILTVCVCCVLWTCGCLALRTDQCIHDQSAESTTEINSPLYVGKRTSNLMVKNNFKNKLIF